MFLVVLSYSKPLTEVDRFAAEHRAFLDRYYASGNFLLSGRREPRTGGVILCVARSRSEVEDIVRDDPFYREKIAEYEIVEFVPTLTATHLTQLKAPGY
jgi:uncharacterized protein YciI